MWITDWTTRAACKGTDPDELFIQGAAQNRAKLICRGCPVRTECLADALDNGIEFGVWGGMTERERRALLRRRPDVNSWRELLERARDWYERQGIDELVAGDAPDPSAEPPAAPVRRWRELLERTWKKGTRQRGDLADGGEDGLPPSWQAPPPAPVARIAATPAGLRPAGRVGARDHEVLQGRLPAAVHLPHPGRPGAP